MGHTAVVIFHRKSLCTPKPIGLRAWVKTKKWEWRSEQTVSDGYIQIRLYDLCYVYIYIISWKIHNAYGLGVYKPLSLIYPKIHENDNSFLAFLHFRLRYLIIFFDEIDINNYSKSISGDHPIFKSLRVFDLT